MVDGHETNTKESPEFDGENADTYIKKWVDYSSKYGLGYSLSNGNCGVFFNDCTKIVYNHQKNYF